jgi:Domain of unknown function (DUF1816)
MGFLTSVKSVLAGFWQGVATQWWLEITTTRPRCTYYFGPFNVLSEAETACPGYIQDLQSEGAQGIVTIVKRCNPKQITVCDDWD